MRRRCVDPRRVLARHGLAAKKSWGQNFLHDRSVLARIVAAVGATADDVVVEIGAGLGTLTAALAQAAPAPRRVLAVERDPDMQRVLAAELGGDARVEVVGADALAFDYLAARRAAGRPVIVVGNLPYQISSALVLALVAAGARGGVARAVVMVQREMAQRIVAPPGSRTYGRLTVGIAQHAEARILFHVRPGSFHPAPAVTSSVLSLVPRAAPLAPVRDAGAVRGGGQAGVRDPAQDAAAARSPGSSATTRSPRRLPRAASRARNAPSSCRSRTSRGSRTRLPTAPPAVGRRRSDAMPELPEVETIVRGLAPRLRGRRIESVWWSGKPLHLRRKVDLRGLRAVAIGRAIAGVRRIGKFILVAVDGAASRRMLPACVHATSG